MSDHSQEDSELLSGMELAKVEELQSELRRKLSIILADPSTPEIFKNAFIKNEEDP